MLTIKDSNNDVEKLGIPQLTQCNDIFRLFNALYTGKGCFGALEPFCSMSPLSSNNSSVRLWCPFNGSVSGRLPADDIFLFNTQVRSC